MGQLFDRRGDAEMKSDSAVSRIDGGPVASDQVSSCGIAARGVDWAQLVAEAGLEADEITYLTANRIQNIPRRDIAAALGWSEARVERVRRRVDRRLAQIRGKASPELPIRREITADGGSSLRPFYRETLPSGRRLWSLSSSNLTMCPKLPIYSGPILTGAHMQGDLQTELREASLKFDGLVVKAQAARHHVDEIETRLDRLRHDEETDGVAAAGDGRTPDAKLAKAIVAAEADLKAASKIVEFHAKAVTAAQTAVYSIKGDITKTRKAAFLAASKPTRERIRALLVELGSQVDGYRQMVSDFGEISAFSEALFPYDPKEYSSGDSWRHPALQIVGTAGTLHANDWARPTVESAWKKVA